VASEKSLARPKNNSPYEFLVAKRIFIANLGRALVACQQVHPYFGKFSRQACMSRVNTRHMALDMRKLAAYIKYQVLLANIRSNSELFQSFGTEPETATRTVTPPITAMSLLITETEHTHAKA
jgi:hypothetical protein